MADGAPVAAAPVAAPAAPDAKPADAQAKPPEAPKWEGIEYTVKGQKRKETDPERVRRLVERGAGFETELENVAKSKAELAPLAELRALLDSGDEDAIERALEGKLGKKLDKIAERRLMRELQREDQYKDMTPRERQMAEELERTRAEREALANQQKTAAERAKQEAEQAEVAKYQGAITDSITKTLDALKLPPKLDALAASFMQPLLKAELESGVLLDPAARAEKVEAVLSGIQEWRLANLEGEALLKALGPGVDKKVRAALLARLEGGQPAGAVPAQQTQVSSQGQQRATGTTHTPLWDPRRIR